MEKPGWTLQLMQKNRGKEELSPPEDITEKSSFTLIHVFQSSTCLIAHRRTIDVMHFHTADGN